MRKLAILTLVILGIFLLTNQSYAAVPLLDDFLGVIPAPVKNFFNMLERFDFGSNTDVIENTLTGEGKSARGFLEVIWSLFLTLLKGVGSVFVWVFRTIANFLESLIFS